MPSSHKSDATTKTSTKVATALKRKASKIIRAVLPKKKQKGPTGDTISLLSTESTEIVTELAGNGSKEPTVVNSDNEERDIEESEDAKLGTPLFFSEKKNSDWIPSGRLKKEWNAPIYVFFQPTPNLGYDNGQWFHEFICAAKGCKKKIQCYLDMKDAKSTSNLQKHAKQCWGTEAVEAINGMKDVSEAQKSIVGLGHKNGTITAIFERAGKGKVTYSHRQHTKTETKFVLASQHRVVPAWPASPNHKAFVALTAHFEEKGVPLCLILDVIEVAQVCMHQ